MHHVSEIESEGNHLHRQYEQIYSVMELKVKSFKPLVANID